MDNLRCETVAGVNSHFAVVTKEEILQMLIFLAWGVLSMNFYKLIQLSSSISMNKGVENFASMHVGKYSATIPFSS